MRFYVHTSVPQEAPCLVTPAFALKGRGNAESSLPLPKSLRCIHASTSA